MLMRHKFAELLHTEMSYNLNVYLLVGDLGFKMFDQCFIDYPNRCINVGAAEQSMIGIATGLAWSGKTPFCYSITPFLLYRPFEWIRNYLSIGQAPVKLIGSGRGKDYKDDGITHFSTDAQLVLSSLIYDDSLTLNETIKQYYPEKDEDIDQVFRDILTNRKPSFVSLRR